MKNNLRSEISNPQICKKSLKAPNFKNILVEETHHLQGGKGDAINDSNQSFSEELPESSLPGKIPDGQTHF